MSCIWLTPPYQNLKCEEDIMVHRSLQKKYRLTLNLYVGGCPNPLSDDVFSLRINVKMPTIIGILTFMKKINFMLS